MDDLLEEIRRRIGAGTVIPKPRATADFIVKGWGRRRGEPALVYLIPNHKDPTKPHEKGITEAEFRRCLQQLAESGTLTRSWFNQNLPACAEEGACNFTTVGGILELLGLARHQPGVYVRTRG